MSPAWLDTATKSSVWRGVDRMVHGVGGGNGADQDEHDQAHALLSVVRAMEETDAGACQQQQAANPERRRCVAHRRFVQSLIRDDLLA